MTDVASSPYRANILVVDDSAENLTAVKAVLEPLGQNLICVRSGEEALKQVLNHDFALILLDVHMGGMDGFETAAAIKHRPRSRHVPIIFLTAVDSDPYHALRGYSEGAVDYISKPIDAWVLRSKVTVFVELALKNRELAEQARALEEYNAELVRLTDAANAAVLAKSQFLNMVGHELRTPLTVIGGYASMLKDGSLGEFSDRACAAVTVMEAKAQELRGLVDSLLAAARVESNVEATQRHELDVAEVVRAACERAGGRVTLLAGELNADIADTPLPASVDPGQVGHILDNLLNNAMTYGGSVRITVSARREGDMISIRIADNGPGIPSEYHEAIFERFVRATEPGLEPGGTGLGLYISRVLAARNGGSLHLERSVVGEGSTFRLELPAADVAVEVPASVPALEQLA